MTKKETAQIIYILKEYYPRDFESTDLETKVTAWHLVLADYDYKLVQNAVVAFVSNDTKGFMPSVGQLVEKIKQLANPEIEMTEAEAWGKVYKAICNSAYNSVSEFGKLPEPIKRAIGSPEVLKSWSQVNIEEVNTVIQSNFMRSYKNATTQQKEYEALPSATKDFTKQLANKMSMGLLTE